MNSIRVMIESIGVLVAVADYLGEKRPRDEAGAETLEKSHCGARGNPLSLQAAQSSTGIPAPAGVTGKAITKPLSLQQPANKLPPGTSILVTSCVLGFIPGPTCCCSV